MVSVRDSDTPKEPGGQDDNIEKLSLMGLPDSKISLTYLGTSASPLCGQPGPLAPLELPVKNVIHVLLKHV